MEKNELVHNAIIENPGITAREINRKFGFSLGSIAMFPAWRILQASRQAKMGKRSIRPAQLSDSYSRMTGELDDPSIALDEKEELESQYFNAVGPEDQEKYRRASPDDQAGLLACFEEQCKDDRSSKRKRRNDQRSAE